MSNKNEQLAMNLALLHVDAMHGILSSVEHLVDARVAASVYIARAGQIMATLRKHGLTNRDEIEQLAEMLLLSSMTDKNAVAAQGADGTPILTAEEKGKLN